MAKPTGIALIKLSLRQIMKDKSLLLVPVISGVLTFLMAAVFLGLFALLLFAGGDNSQWVKYHETGDLDPWVNPVFLTGFVVLFAVSATITTFTRATMVAAAMERLDGGDPTVGSAWRTARRNAKTLFVYVGVQTLLETVLARTRSVLSDGGWASAIVERIGLAGVSAANMAYKYASFLSVPVILQEHLGFKDSIIRSGKLVTEKFGTAFRTVAAATVYRLAIVLIAFGPLLAVLGYALSLGASIGTQDATSGSLLIGLMLAACAWLVLTILLASLFFPLVDAYYSVLIYRYAAGLPIEGIDPAVLESSLPPVVASPAGAPDGASEATSAVPPQQ